MTIELFPGSGNGGGNGGGVILPYAIIPKKNNVIQSIASSGYMTWRQAGVAGRDVTQYNGSTITEPSGTSMLAEIPSGASFSKINLYISLHYQLSANTGMYFELQKNGSIFSHDNMNFKIYASNSNAQAVSGKQLTIDAKGIPVSALDRFEMYIIITLGSIAFFDSDNGIGPVHDMTFCRVEEVS